MNYPAIPREFFNGDCFDAYRILGAHPCSDNGIEGWRFAVWAPGATAVEVCGGFDGWEAGVPMEKADTGVWSAFVPGLAEGDLYKYRVHGADGSVVMRSDPYAFSTELRPGTASRLTKLDFAFDDHAWMERRDKCRNRPLNIYEMHVGSWRHKPGSKQEDGSDGWYNYEELAKELIPWLLDHHFTHVELLPLAEHPFDGSWGYQTTGYFSVTSRYGTPAQFAGFVNACHRMGIGVIMDFVPVHFAANADALAKFDGTYLYEYDSDVGHSEWGTCNFNYYRREVCSFLNSAAALWMDVYHCDGIRMDAISRAIYWNGNPARGVNERAVEFLRNMNAGLHKLHPSAILMAEDSTDFPKVTAPTEYDGLGFDYKWDMGFMNDTLRFFQTAPVYRPYDYHKLSFSMMYFYSDLFLLPFSHDEVVHGKATIIQKMWGDYENKFPQAKAFYTYVYAHPGKKLNFMGNEFAQFREWDETREQDWDILKYPLHDAFHHFYAKLAHLYLEERALYDGEYNQDCFEWLEVDAADYVTYAWERRAGGETIVTVMNLSDQFWKDFPVGLPMYYELEELLNTDWKEFGGNTSLEDQNFRIVDEEHRKRPQTLYADLPPFTARMFKVKGVKTPAQKKDVPAGRR